MPTKTQKAKTSVKKAEQIAIQKGINLKPNKVITAGVKADTDVNFIRNKIKQQSSKPNDKRVEAAMSKAKQMSQPQKSPLRRVINTKNAIPLLNAKPNYQKLKTKKV